MAMSQIILSMVLFLAAANAQTFSWGGCPSVKPVSNFSVTQFGNKVWYEQARTLNLYEITGKCPISNIMVIGLNVTVVNIQIDLLNGTTKYLAGSGLFPALENTTATIEITYPTYTLKYDVLGTDYGTYAAVSACQNFWGFFSFRYLWILSPNRFAPQGPIDAANATFVAQGLDVKDLNRTDTLWCPFIWP